MSGMLPRLRRHVGAPRGSVLLGALAAAAEPLGLAAGVDDALGPGEERMAHRAHLCLQLGERGSGREAVAAQAMHFGVGVVLGMDAGFHGRSGWGGREEITIPRPPQAQSSAMETGLVKLPCEMAGSRSKVVIC